MKFAIIEGSVRDGRAGTSVARWVAQEAAGREGVEYDHISVADFDLPMLTSSTPPGAAKRNYDSEAVTAWGETIDRYDGFVFVTPEYNHSVPGAFKNAVDSLGPEWQGKALALVSYGADGGVRAVEHWRQIMANFNMYVVRSQVSLSLFSEFGEDGLQPNERRGKEIAGLFDALEKAAGQVRPS